jgi:hypothetical protein
VKIAASDTAIRYQIGGLYARKSAGNWAFYPADEGVNVRSSRRQSMPSGSMESWVAVIITEPALADVHTKRPRSIRVENKHMHAPSY